MTRFKNIFSFLIFLLLFCFSSWTYSGPWLIPSSPWPESANMASKSDIDLLADYGFIHAPVLTWPIAWANVGPALLSDASQKKIKHAPAFVQLIYFRVVGQYRRATETNLKPSVYLSGGHKVNPFRTFEFQPRGDFNGGIAAEKQGQHWAGNLALTYGRYRDMTNNVHLDDSYAYGFLGNWALGVDKMQRWWGPGYSDSMILSANAPPLPALTLQRMRADAFQSKWLSWIGPWSFTTSLAVGGEDVPVPHPLIWLANLAFRPLESLQFGISRAAFFAGDSRPLNWRMFGNLLLVEDNCNSAKQGVDYCNKYTPGTEHWEITADWNWFKTWHIPANIYLQTIFNDRVPDYSAQWLYALGKPPIPGRTAFLAGGSTWFPVSTGLLRLYAEFEYTYEYVYFFWGELVRNIYGYSNYPYTYYGKILGSALGDEAKGYTIGGVFNEANGNSDTFMIRLLNLNGWNMVGAGYPFPRQDILWLSLGRTVALPFDLGRLSGQLGYLESLKGQGIKSTPSAFLAWSKSF